MTNLSRNEKSLLEKFVRWINFKIRLCILRLKFLVVQGSKNDDTRWRNTRKYASHMLVQLGDSVNWTGPRGFHEMRLLRNAISQLTPVRARKNIWIGWTETSVARVFHERWFQGFFRFVHNLKISLQFREDITRFFKMYLSDDSLFLFSSLHFSFKA